MRTIAITVALLPVLLASAAGYQDLYRPDTWIGGSVGSVTYTYGNGKSQTFEVDENGYSPTLESAIDEYRKKDIALAMAFQALYEGLQAQVMVDGLAFSVDAMFAGGVAAITDADGTSSSGTYKFTSKAEGNKVELSLTGVQTVKAGGGLEKSQGKMSISGWDSKDGNSYSIADVLSGNAEGPFADYTILARMAKGGSMDYVKIGKLALTNGTPVLTDGFSITTNENGRIQMIGFRDEASEGDVPVCRGSDDGKVIRWRTIDDAVFAIGDGGEEGYKISLKGYAPDLGANRYLGSGEDGAWGVHELPNVTTNNVVADETTITTEGSPTPEQKVFRLKSVPPVAGYPFAATLAPDGGIAYIPLPEAVTNESSECDCTQKWERVATWLGDFDLLEATPWLFGFPSSWLGYAVERSNGDGYSGQRGLLDIKGFALGDPCGKNLNLGDLLMGTATDAATERENHVILTRYYAGSGDPTVHYLPIGEIASTTKADGRSIVTNENGVLSIAGFLDAPEQAGLMPVTRVRGMGDMTLEWVEAGGGANVDGVTIVTNASEGAVSQGVASISGWTSASNDTYLSKGPQGALEWRRMPSIYNVAWQYDPQSRTWRNAHVMIGTEVVSVDSSQVVDGAYYVEVDCVGKTAALVATPGTSDDTTKFIYVGTVANGVQTDGIYTTPIVFVWE